MPLRWWPTATGGVAALENLLVGDDVRSL